MTLFGKGRTGVEILTNGAMIKEYFHEEDRSNGVNPGLSERVLVIAPGDLFSCEPAGSSLLLEIVWMAASSVAGWNM